MEKNNEYLKSHIPEDTLEADAGQEDLPELLPPFCLGGRIDFHELPGEVLAICRPSRNAFAQRVSALSMAGSGTGVVMQGQGGDAESAGTENAAAKETDSAFAALFRRDGTLIRRIPLPGNVVFAAARGNRIYGFRSDAPCIVTDLEGDPVPVPWKDWPQEEVIYDLSADGRFLLYRESRFPTDDRRKEVRAKDLETGDETVYPDAHTHDLPMILDDRRVLFQTRWKNNKLSVCDLTDGQLKNSFLDGFCQCYGLDRKRGLIVAAADRVRNKKEVFWAVFDLEGRLLHEWQEDGIAVTGFVLAPGPGFLACVVQLGFGLHERYALRVRDYLTGRVIFDEPVEKGTVPCMSPDGGIVYAADEEGRVLDGWIFDDE